MMSKTKKQFILENAGVIMRRHLAGEGFAAIAPSYGVSALHMRNVLREAGYPVADHSSSKSRAHDRQSDQFVRLWQDGTTVNAIANRFGVNPRTVRRRLVQAGVYDAKRDRSIPGGRGIPILEFIEIWQTSDTIRQAAERLGISPQAASSRASIYRRRGVPMKYMSSRQGYDWDELADFADAFNFSDQESVEDSDDRS